MPVGTRLILCDAQEDNIRRTTPGHGSERLKRWHDGNFEYVGIMIGCASRDALSIDAYSEVPQLPKENLTTLHFRDQDLIIWALLLGA